MAFVRSVIALVTALVLASGCALSISAPDPDRPRLEVPRCDTGKGLVAGDAVWGTLFGVAALAAMSSDETGPGIALGGVSALAFASAVRGNKAATRCREAFDAYYAEVRAVTERERMATAVKRTRAPVAEAPAMLVEPRLPFAVKPAAPAPAAEPAPQATLEPAPEPAPAPPPRAQPKPPPATDDDWSAFWKELP